MNELVQQVAGPGFNKPVDEAAIRKAIADKQAKEKQASEGQTEAKQPL